MSERIVGIVKAYPVGSPGSIVVVIPKEAYNELVRHPKGQRFLVKVDEEGRLIYEPLRETESPTEICNGNKEAIE